MQSDFGESEIPKHILVLAWLNPIWFLNIPLQLLMLYSSVALGSHITSSHSDNIVVQAFRTFGNESDFDKSVIPKHILVLVWLTRIWFLDIPIAVVDVVLIY